MNAVPIGWPAHSFQTNSSPSTALAWSSKKGAGRRNLIPAYRVCFSLVFLCLETTASQTAKRRPSEGSPVRRCFVGPGLKGTQEATH